MNKLFLFILSFLLSTYGWSANRYVVAAGGNSNSTATWSATSGGAGGESVPTNADDVFLDSASGQLTINAAFFCKSFNCTGYTNTLTHSAVATVSGDITLVSGMTYNPISSFAINANSTLISAGKLLSSLYLGVGTITLGDDLNFKDAKGVVLQFSSDTNPKLDLNGHNISGYSNTSRVFFQTSVLGSQKQVIVNGGTFANADFRDIEFSSASDLDLSGITGGSGDCGGNSITGGGTVLTFTTPATQTATMSTNKNWSDASIWTSRVPLPQDDVSLADVTGGTLTADMPRLGKTIDWTGAIGSPTFAVTSIDVTVYGGLTLISGLTYTSSKTFSFEGRGNFNITMNGKIFWNLIYIKSIGGKYTLLDNFASTSNIDLQNGEFDANDFTVSISELYSNYSSTRILRMGNGVWNCTSASEPWKTISTGFTVYPEGSTIKITDTSAINKTFYNSGSTLGDINILGGGSGAVSFTQSGGYGDMVIGTPKTVTFTSGTTQTVSSFTAVGTATDGITLQSTSAGSPATLSDASGMNLLKYCTIKDITATGGATWLSLLAMGNVNVSGNAGWIWNAGLGIIMIND